MLWTCLKGDWVRCLAYEVEGIRLRVLEIDLRRFERKLLTVT